jgi:hypothetical protein
MRLTKHEMTGLGALFRAQLDQIISRYFAAVFRSPSGRSGHQPEPGRQIRPGRSKMTRICASHVAAIFVASQFRCTVFRCLAHSASTVNASATF